MVGSNNDQRDKNVSVNCGSSSVFNIKWDRKRAGRARGRGERYKVWAMKNVARVECDLGLVGKIDKKSRKRWSDSWGRSGGRLVRRLSVMY